MAIERDASHAGASTATTAVMSRIDEIARAVEEVRTPLSFADQLYVLRDHVAAVRRRVQGALGKSSKPPTD